MIVLLLAAFTAAVFAVPVENVVSFQGKLVESGIPVDGTRNIHFYLYDVETGGTSIWNENHLAVPVVAGLFNVELGGTALFGVWGVDFMEQYWISISVEEGVEIRPRYKLTSDPYALTGSDVDWTNTYGGVIEDTDSIYHTGNVGIGTTSPNKKLDVRSEIGVASADEEEFIFLKPESSNEASINFHGSGKLLFNAKHSYTPIFSEPSIMTITGAGNVGIGTTDPGGKLDIRPGNTTYGLYMDYDRTTSGTTYGIHVDLDNTYSGDEEDFGIYVNVENASGNDDKQYGIYNELQNNGSGPSYGYYSNSKKDSDVGLNYGGYFRAEDGLIAYGIYAGAYGATTNWAGYFDGGNVYIKNNVGIGTASPTFKLDVAGTANMIRFRMPTGASNTYVLTSDATGNGTWQATTADGDWTNTYGGVIEDNDSIYHTGNVGIGTTSPGAKLDVQRSFALASGGKGVNVNVTGTATWPSWDYGIYSNVNQNTSQSAGLYAKAVSPSVGSGRNWGVRAYADNGGTNIAIEGYIDGDGSDDAAIVGVDNSIAGYNATNINMGPLAGYFWGDVRVTGKLFDSSGDAGTSGQLLSSTVTGTNWITAADGADNDWAAVGGGDPALAGDIYHTGNVGIGTVSPSNKLQVVAGADTAIYATGSDLTVGYFKNTITGNYQYYGVYGECVNTNDAYGYGGYFKGKYMGVEGVVLPTGNQNYYGVYGYVAGGSGENYAVTGSASGNGDNYAFTGLASGSGSGDSYGMVSHAISGGSGNSYGVMGYAIGFGTNYGIYGEAVSGTTNWAGFFNGAIYAVSASGGIKSFLIDHPSDPEHKLLRHYCVESNEVLLIYRGKTKLDENGTIRVLMPNYFEDLADKNGATVTLTPIGTKPFLASYVWDENSISFTIYGKPNGEVSWSVYANRDDPIKQMFVKPIEEQKGEGKACSDGKLLVPEAYGYPKEMGTSYNPDHEKKHTPETE